MNKNPKAATGEGDAPRVKQLESDVAYWEKHHNGLQRALNAEKVQSATLLREFNKVTAQRDELLAALKDMIAGFEDGDDNWQVTQARAAITKAEGRA